MGGPYVNLSTIKAYLVQQANAERRDRIRAIPPFQLVGDERSRHVWLQSRYRRASQKQLVNHHLEIVSQKLDSITILRKLVRSRSYREREGVMMTGQTLPFHHRLANNLF